MKAQLSKSVAFSRKGWCDLTDRSCVKGYVQLIALRDFPTERLCPSVEAKPLSDLAFRLRHGRAPRLAEQLPRQP